MVGVSNRIVAGMMIHTTRAAVEDCASSRFSHLGPECASESGLDLSPYGVVGRYRLTLSNPR